MILLLSKNGYVSKRFQDFFLYKKIDYKVISLSDVFNKQQFLKETLEKTNPKFVINCIGYTGKPNVDSCENQKEECFYSNVTLTEMISNECKNKNIPLGIVSSGCIYNETDPFNVSILNEEDEPNFCFSNENSDCSYYSGTKALGEKVALDSWEKSYIWRLRMPFNHIDDNRNFISKILKYDKIWSSPNSLSNVDEFVRNCYYSLVKEIPYGIYNMVNPGGISAKQILEIGKEYNVFKNKYEYFDTIEEFNKTVKARRSNCVLSSDKIANEGIAFLDSESSVRKCFESWKQEKNILFW